MNTPASVFFESTNLVEERPLVSERLRSLPPSEWDLVWSVARQQNVQHWFSRHAGVAERVGEGVRGTSYYWWVAHRAAHLRFLNRLMEAAEGAHLPVLVLKGLALEALVYPATGLRFSVDVDLLFDPRDRAAVGRLLRRMGAAPRDHERFWNTERWRSAEGVPLDVHFGTPWGEHFSLLHERAQEIPLDGFSVKVPCNEDLFLLLSCHLGFNHRYAPRLTWITDLHLLMAKRPPDWTVLARRARSLGYLKLVRRAVRVVETTYGLPVPVPGVLRSRQSIDVWDLLVRPRGFRHRYWNERSYITAFDHPFRALGFYARRGWARVCGGR